MFFFVISFEITFNGMVEIRYDVISILKKKTILLLGIDNHKLHTNGVL